jgi:superfamily II DNA or RNA helicase
MKMKKIILESWQKEWAMKSAQILSNNYFYMDHSVLGTGKTIIALHLAQLLNEPIIVICPIILIDKWKSEISKYGMDDRLLCIVNYEQLRLSKGKVLQNGLLTRTDKISKKGIHKVKFEPTPQYLELIERGAFVIFDEFHKVKNDNDTHKAFTALLKVITSMDGGNSRFGLLSGSPLDKDEHVVNLLKGIGFITKRNLFHTDSSTKIITLDGYGLQQLIDACDVINHDLTSEIINNSNMTGVRYYRTDPKTGDHVEISNLFGKYAKREELHKLCLLLYSGVIKNRISGGMLPPVSKDSKFKHSTKNTFYSTNDQISDDVNNALNDLDKLSNNDNDNKILGIRKILNEIETGKFNIFLEAARKILNEDPNSKVIIALNCIQNIVDICSALKEYNSLSLYGATKQRDRTKILKDFNFNKLHRVLVMNPEVTGIGIDLHDTIGDAPRTLLISPDYNFITLYQTTGRINRRGIKSNSSVKIVYCLEARREVKIRQAIAAKSTTMKMMLEEKGLDYIKLPDEYETEVIELE